MDRQKVGGRSQGTVVFQSAGDFWREVIAEFEIRRKHEPLILAQAVDRIVKGRIEGPVPAADFLVHDRAHFPRPGVGGILPALIAHFVRKAYAHRPMPFFRNAKARPDMVAHPLPSLAGIHRSKDIKSHFEPVVEAVRDLDGFMFGVIGRVYAICDLFAAVNGEIAVQLHHRVARFNRLRAVHLNFVIVLCAGRRGAQQQACQHRKG